MKRIDQMYLYATADHQNEYEIVPVVEIGLRQVPLIAATRARADSLRGYAEAIANAGATVTLCRFEIRTDLEKLT